ncbi:unnamed protein product [Spirodela intermedia]|uniref:Uncharacterized protein n=1 Tax=Spirodela intermedia TaxID=51605 RepID=A0A7I8JYC6_SPIIN|nr:unnamed protein product [Spirodela intermedia]
MYVCVYALIYMMIILDIKRKKPTQIPRRPIRERERERESMGPTHLFLA